MTAAEAPHESAGSAAREPLWTPDPARAAKTRMAAFLARVADEEGLPDARYDTVWSWSTARPERFWAQMWEELDPLCERAPERVLVDPHMPGARWFEGARLNFAENLLRRAGGLVLADESGAVQEIGPVELRDQVARCARTLRGHGVVAGDRVAGFLPNGIEAVVTFLAAASIGAIWSSCSPDFGMQGVLDRFGQIEPKVLVARERVRYNGKEIDLRDRVHDIARSLPTLRATLTDWSAVTGAPVSDLSFAALPPDHPIYVLYSSGTTGVPKCIVHGAGGVLVNHAKELLLHSEVGPGDTLFYYTTCGWMMWNWLVSGLLTGARIVLYDGSPTFPDPGVLWRLTESAGITHFGTSPKYLAALQMAGYRPRDHHDLGTLRAMLSTGSPLSPEQFRWVYDAVKTDLQLASISGGTDLVGCFMLGSPVDPVYAGEIQKRGLGMAVEAWDANGKPVSGEKGELVCTVPFPSMPVRFWNDPDGAKYRDAYFAHYPGVWRHGDWIEITSHGGVIVYGRSDATLNPGGVRIGTAEIDRVVEGTDGVVDSLVVGQDWKGDVRIVLFVVLAPGRALDDTMRAELRARIRAACTPRHVPAKIVQIAEVPRTISGKKVELAVTRMLKGDRVDNRDALANPDALDQILGIEDLWR